MQSEFATGIFTLCKERGIDTCLDTSGCVLDDSVEKLLEVADRVLLDVKYTNDEDYLKYVGCSLELPLKFLQYLDSKNIPTTVRQVVIPTINDSRENYEKLKQIAEKYKCVDKTELLPFRKICQTKYDAMGIPFPFAHIEEKV